MEITVSQGVTVAGKTKYIGICETDAEGNWVTIDGQTLKELMKDPVWQARFEAFSKKRNN